MMLVKSVLTFVAVTIIAGSAAAATDPKAEYAMRSAERYLGRFLVLDRNNDGVVTRDEAHGDLNFVPRFDDMDINRDGAVTAAELERFVQQVYGVTVSVGRPVPK